MERKGESNVAIRWHYGVGLPGLCCAFALLTANPARGATATFTPLGPTIVRPGTDVMFSVSVAVEALSGFDSADIVIGSNGAADITFAYSAAWLAAFQTVTTPTPDLGLYAQDIFVGGNNPNPVGASIVLGTVTAMTNGLGEGRYDLRIDTEGVGAISSLTLGGTSDFLRGTAVFEIECATFDPECDIDVDLFDYRLLRPCIAGPGRAPAVGCRRYDADGDSDVDLKDVAAFLVQFTGQQ